MPGPGVFKKSGCEITIAEEGANGFSLTHGALCAPSLAGRSIASVNCQASVSATA